MRESPDTPFPVTGYYGPAYFCDRESEIAHIKSHLAGGVPVVIIGARRLGKTGLIRHLFGQIKQPGIFVDLQGTESINGLAEKLAEGIGNTFPEKSHTKIWNALKSLRPTLSFDPFSGSPQFGFNFQQADEGRHTMQSLLELLSKQSKNTVIAFDEFQQIMDYPDKATEGIIRSQVQKFPNVRFLFSGSQTHLLSAMFEEGSRPFFANAAKLYLEKLDPSIYGDFILEKFAEVKKTIAEDQVREILRWTDTHTYYTQYFCNQLCMGTSRKITADHIETLKWKILQTSRQDFFLVRDLLTRSQWRLLTAVAKEEALYQPYARKAIDTYRLSTPAAIRKAIKTLLDKQLINVFYNENGERYYKVADVFLMRFIQQYM
jgi:hypothetical protein